MSGTSFGRRFVERPWLVSLILILLLVAWLAAGQLKAQGDHTHPHLSNLKTRLS